MRWQAVRYPPPSRNKKSKHDSKGWGFRVLGFWGSGFIIGVGFRVLGVLVLGFRLRVTQYLLSGLRSNKTYETMGYREPRGIPKTRTTGVHLHGSGI